MLDEPREIMRRQNTVNQTLLDQLSEIIAINQQALALLTKRPEVEQVANVAPSLHRIRCHKRDARGLLCWRIVSKTSSAVDSQSTAPRITVIVVGLFRHCAGIVLVSVRVELRSGYLIARALESHAALILTILVVSYFESSSLAR
jgi:hypothetical protein